jgi:hypothetical protein
MDFAASQAAFAAALVDPAKPVPAGVVSPRGESDAKRFAVYRNNVFVGLTEALAKRFPVTRRLVGEEFFTGMARVFAGQSKPASPLLFQYGDDFPAFIDTFEPAGSVAYLGDVARIEAAWSRAYHAEDVAPLAAAALAVLDPAKLPTARLAVHPAAALMTSPHPAGTIWAAHQGEAVTPVAEWQAETVLIARPALDVTVHVLPQQGAVFALQLFAGATLGLAADAAFAADSRFDFGSALLGLIGLGAFCTVDTAASRAPLEG